MQREVWLLPPGVSDSREQGGSCSAVFYLDSKVTPSLLPQSVGATFCWSHTQPKSFMKGNETETYLLGGENRCGPPWMTSPTDVETPTPVQNSHPHHLPDRKLEVSLERTKIRFLVVASHY